LNIFLFDQMQAKWQYRHKQTSKTHLFSDFCSALLQVRTIVPTGSVTHKRIIERQQESILLLCDDRYQLTEFDNQWLEPKISIFPE